MSKVKEFLKKHEKEVMITGGFILGIVATLGCVVLHKKHLLKTSRAFLHFPKKLKNGKYEIIFGIITKANKYLTIGCMNSTKEEALKMAEIIMEAAHSCGRYKWAS